jgi:hypothetical protein
MSVHSVSTGLLPYDALSRSNSQTAKAAAIAPELRGSRDVQGDLFRVNRGGVEGAAAGTAETAARSGDAPGAGDFHSPFERAHAGSGSTAGNGTAGAAESPAARQSPGIALYERVSQYGSGALATSALLKSWNEIMHGGQEADGAVAAFAKELSQHETSGFVPAVLDLTA